MRRKTDFAEFLQTFCNRRAIIEPAKNARRKFLVWKKEGRNGSVAVRPLSFPHPRRKPCRARTAAVPGLPKPVTGVRLPCAAVPPPVSGTDMLLAHPPSCYTQGCKICDGDSKTWKAWLLGAPSSSSARTKDCSVSVTATPKPSKLVTPVRPRHGAYTCRASSIMRLMRHDSWATVE